MGTAHFDSVIGCVQYGPAGDAIAAGVPAHSNGRIHLICTQTLQAQNFRSCHSDFVSSVDFNPTNPSQLVSGSSDKTIRL